MAHENEFPPIKITKMIEKKETIKTAVSLVNIMLLKVIL